MSNIRIMPAALEKMKKEARPYTIYLASRGGWGGSYVTPAVQAGIPVKESDYLQTEIEGVTIYYRKDMADFVFEIQWVGFWVFGQFVVKEIDVA